LLQHIADILFSELSFEYQMQGDRSELIKKISKPDFWSKNTRGQSRYSIQVSRAPDACTIIRRGRFWPIIITIMPLATSDGLKVTFKSLVSPLFIPAPILVFMWPTLNFSRNASRAIDSTFLFLLSVLLAFGLAFLMVYLPVRKERKHLEKSFNLVDRDNLTK